jgi:hypothetical protein
MIREKLPEFAFRIARRRRRRRPVPIDVELQPHAAQRIRAERLVVEGDDPQPPAIEHVMQRRLR